MSDQELSAFCDLLLSVRRAKRAFLVAGFEPERWDNFAAGLRRQLRDAIITGELDQALRTMTRRANDFRLALQVERARLLRAHKVPGSDSVYQLDSSD